MSGEARSERPVNPLFNILGSMDGTRIRGGCESCDAWQEMKTIGGGVFSLDVYHDDGCPVLLAKGRK
jgi:hypothetical protein